METEVAAQHLALSTVVMELIGLLSTEDRQRLLERLRVQMEAGHQGDASPELKHMRQEDLAQWVALLRDMT